MIDLAFLKGTETVGIKVLGKTIQFCKMQGAFFRYAPIEGLKLSTAGILQEFPDLKGKPERTIKKIAIKRFKEHINGLRTEKQVQDYVIKDLKKHGYKIKAIKRAGFRPKVFK